MSEEAKAAPVADKATSEAGEADSGATDWQAKYEAMRQHSREWERRA